MTFVFKHPSKYKKEKLENQKENPIVEMLKKDNCKYSGKNRLEFVKEQMVESYKKHYPNVKEKENESINKISK